MKGYVPKDPRYSIEFMKYLNKRNKRNPYGDMDTPRETLFQMFLKNQRRLALRRSKQ